uniref:mannosyl-3-phosphoglycerate synthase n=1 Tax=Thermococcus sp. TaxID=35749 RepID=UPI0025F343BB
ILSSLGTIYHSELATEGLKERILNELRIHGLLKENEEPPRPKVMPPVENIDIGGWMKTLDDEAETLLKFEV